MATQDIEKLLVQFNADFKGYQREMLKLNGVTDRQARQIERRFQQMNRNISRSLQNAGRGLSAGVGRLGAAAGLGLGTNEVIQYADAWTRSKAQLQVAGVEISRVTGKQQELLDVSKRSRVAFTDTVALYTRLSLAARDLGTSEADVTRVTETLSKALQIGGASTGEAASAMLQFSQALASGVLQGDELRSLRENAPIVAQAIAKEFGVTVGELKKLGAEGELTSGRIVKAILGIGNEVDKQFADLPQTVGQAFTSLQNNILEAIGVIDNGSGATQKLVGIINDLAAAIKGLPRAAQSVGSALQPVGDLLTAAKGDDSYIEDALRQGDFKTATFGKPGTALRSIANLFMGSDLNDQLYEINKQQERRLELEKKISEAVATNTSLPLLAGWRQELAEINGQVERLTQIAGPSFESKGRGAQFPSYVKADDKPTKPTRTPTPDKVSDVLKNLRFEEEQLKRTSREQEIYNQLQRAGVDISSAYGKTIADLAGKIYDAELAKRIFEGNQERIQQMQIEAKTMGLTAEAAAYLATKEEMLNEFRREGIAITPELTARIEAEAQAMSKAAGNADQLERIAEVNDTVKDSFKGLITDIATGVEPVDALTDALGRLADKLLDLALDDIFSALTKNGNTGSGISSLVAGLFHSGGVAGSARSSRRVSPLAFAGAPRYHSGGIAGVKPGEVPAILKRGEPILPSMGALRAIVGSRQGGGRVVVNVSNPPGMKTEQRQRQEGGRTLIDLVNAAVDERIASPATQRFFGASYGLRPVLKSR